MKRILFVATHRVGRAPGQRFRYEQYISFLEQNGYECHFSHLLSAADDKKFYSRGKYFNKAFILIKMFLIRIKDAFRASSFDIIVMQREAMLLGTIFFEKRFARSKAKFVFDYDDAIWMIQDTTSSANSNLQWMKRPGKTADIIKLCDLIFAGNRYLYDYAKKYNNNVVIVPTTIDTDEYQPKYTVKSDGRVCIGWSGSTTTIDHFQYAIPALKKIKQKFGDKVYIKVVGDGSYVNEELKIKGLPWNKEKEVSDLQEMDIGIMPLPNDEWTKGKCGLKGLQYMALSIPTIMSPVGVNTEIIQDGENGFLATTEEEWTKKLERLIEDVEFRKMMGQKGRKTVEEKYSVNSQKYHYLEYFNQLVKQ